MSKRHLFLNGFMGAGKSKIGPLLSERLKRPFIDTDGLIERSAGVSIAEIFKKQGEAVFRKLEQETLSACINSPETAVISVGGGTFINPENKLLAERNGCIVYIKSSPREIFKRVRHSSKRPLLRVTRDANFDVNLMQRIEELLEERRAMYESAAIIIERDGMEPVEIAEAILKDYAQLS